MKHYFLIYLILFALVSSNTSGQKIIEDQNPDFDIVFCLDLSGSTNGLIDNFRENIWSIVNQIDNFKPKQNLRIGVVGFSRPSFSKSSAYVKILWKLSGDYDQMIAELWKLKPEVEKGDQFVSNALQIAGFEMNWSKAKNATKILFLVGNGNVNTGSGDYRTVVAEIKRKGIELVPVYCLRTQKTRETEGWQQIGRISDHTYESVWVSKNEQLIKLSPASEKLLPFFKELDKQSVPYTKSGLEIFNAMNTCDQKAMASNPLALENRLFYRISDFYLESVKSWDLTDAGFSNTAELMKADLSLLPDSLRRLSADDLLIKLQQKRERRKYIIAEIKKLLPQSRQEYINELVSREKFDASQNLEWVFLKHIASIGSTKRISVK